MLLFSSIQTILVALLVFALMILVHEIGHFAAAKAFGIRVNEFALGMGPAIFKRKRKDTLYSVRILPIGGFCKMEGEDEQSSDPAAFSNAARWKRFLVLVSGAFLNIVLGFAIFLVFKGASDKVTEPVIGEFIAGTNIVESGLEPGDRIIKLNNTSVHIYEDIEFFRNRISEQPVTVTAKRGDQTITAEVLPSKYETKYTYYSDRIEVETFIKGKSQGVVSYPVNNPELYQDRIGQTGTQTSYILGFVPKSSAPTFFSAVHDAFFRTIFDIKLVYISLYELVLGRVPASQISGPIGMVSLIGTAFRIDWSALFELVALLTVNLGMMNLLPIPALDGGHILFLGIEAVLRRDIPIEKKGIISLVGFALLIALILFASYNDILRLFGAG